MTRFLAFRCYGQFQWPPVPDRSRPTQSREGVVEIHYIQAAAKSPWIGHLRWLPKALFDREPDPRWPGDVKNAYDLNPEEVAKHFEPADASVVLSFSKTTDAKKGGPQLRFEGITVLDQFGFPTKEPLTPVLRIPLVPTLTWGGKVRYSTLQIGSAGDGGSDALRLEPIIPLPLAANTAQQKAKQAFFAFSALYPTEIADSKMQAAGDGLPIETSTFGLPDDDVLANSTGSPLGQARWAPSFAKSEASYKDMVTELTKGEKKEHSLWSDIRHVVENVLGGVGHTAVFNGQDGPSNFKVETEFAKTSGLKRFPGLSIETVVEDKSTLPQFCLSQRFAIKVIRSTSTVSTHEDSRFRCISGDIQLRAPGGRGWLSFGPKIYLQASLIGTIADQDVWAPRLADTKLQLNIGSDQQLLPQVNSRPGEELPPYPSENSRAAVTLPEMLHQTTAAMRLTLASRRQLQAGQPLSLLPELTLKSTGKVHFGLFAQSDVPADAAWGQPLPVPTDVNPLSYRASLQNRDVPTDVNPLSYRASLQNRDVMARVPELEFQARWPAFDVDGAQGAAIDLRAVHADADLSDLNDGACFFALRLYEEPPKNPQQRAGLIKGMRVHWSGALLQVQDKSEGDKSEAASWLAMGWQSITGGSKAPGGELPSLLPRCGGHFWLHLNMALDEVLPVGHEAADDDRRDRTPVLLWREGASGASLWRLEVNESLSGDPLHDPRNWRLKADLIDRGRSAGAAKPTVLFSSEPFSFLRYHALPLADRGDEGIAIVAQYDSDQDRWTTKSTSETYHYVLPPQSVGESMDKPSRLEIHDIDAEPAAGDFARPHPDLAARSLDDDERIARRHLVDFRLTPPADLWIRPVEVERNFMLPEWASRDLFAQLSHGGVGVGLAAFRGEFVYGLAVGLWPEAERGPARRARVAEIEALTGSMLSKIDGDKYEPWRLIHDAFQRRPERLELWADDPDSTVPFAPARFERGARFALRTRALHRPAVLPGPGAAPGASDSPVQRVPDLSPRLHPQGLAGGALWPIESLNVLNMVLDQPQASGGHIESIALSPTGGDADQTVRFCNGIVSIITETRNGHVQRQRVEVIGRIGVWWHRAKHVVIYERTVNPSAQFTPEGGLTSRTRRPVLRKVREFIELLQPERRYPDFPEATPVANGFVQGMRFNSTIIPVDSFWGQDVDTRGWKVPLWNRHAARQRPQVYAMPDIVFLQASEGTTTDAITSQQCLNPDNLYFFTRTAEGTTADTDAWPQERSIDWTNLPPPHSATDADNKLAREAAVPPGFARFTWRLAPAAQRTTVNQARGRRPVYASLRTLTFMRAGRASNASKPLPSAPKSGTTPAADLWRPVRLPVEHPADDSAKDEVKQKLGAMKNFIDGLSGEKAAELWKEQITRRQEFDTQLQNQLGVAVPEWRKGCDDWKRNITGAVGAKRLAIDQELQAWETRFVRTVDDLLKPVDSLPQTTRELTKDIAETISKALRPVFEGATAGIGRAEQGCEAARAAVQDVRGDVLDALAQARRELKAIKAAIDHDRPWSSQRLADLKEQIDSAFDKAVRDAQGAVADACDRLAAEMDAVSQRVGTTVATALRGVDAELLSGQVGLQWASKAALSDLSDVYRSLSEALKQANTTCDQAAQEVNQQRAKLQEVRVGLADELEQNLASIGLSLQTAAKQLDKLVPTVEGLAQRIDASASEAARSLSEALQGIGQSIGELRGMAVALSLEELTHLKQLVTETLVAGSFTLTSTELAGHLIDKLAANDDVIWLLDHAIDWIEKQLDELIKGAAQGIDSAGQWLDESIVSLRSDLAELQDKLKPSQVTQAITDQLTVPLQALIEQSGITFPVTADEAAQAKDRLLSLSKQWREGASKALEVPEALVGGLIKNLDGACKFFESAQEKLEKGADELLKSAIDGIQQNQLYQDIKDDLDVILATPERYAGFLNKFKDFERDVRNIGNDLASTGELVNAYADQAVRAIGDVGKGGLLAAPNNILRAMAAVGSVPALPNLDYARRQMGYYYGLVDDVVDTTKVDAFFGRLGDALKAWGLKLPFSRIGDRLLPDDLSQYDIGTIFRNCGGLELQRLFKGCRLPNGAGDAVRLSHDFNKQTYRAWVQLEVDAALPGRKTLLSVGPFCLNAVDASLVGRVRLEASKDSDRVEDEGQATFNTDFEMVVGGQVMVMLRAVAVRFSKGGGLKVDFDPKKIEINQNLQFVQNALGSIVGDEMGGMTVVKRDGVPVGLEHLFSMPPISVMFGTSGLQNIQITNQFQLVAYPDFRISNRFSLARPELPFIFSIFIIGGTGWLTVDVDYRPFNDELLVVVDAAAGGSASLGFAFCGCTGSVAVTLAAALTYRKLIGSSGGGLTVSMVVTIVGVVDVLRIASAHLSVVLRLSYAENGDIDASGRFRLEVRISRFFKVSAGGEARYRMTGGKRQTQSRVNVDAGPTPEADAAMQAARKKAERLLNGQGA